MRNTPSNRLTRHAAATLCLLGLLLAGCEEQKQAAPPPPPPEVVLAEVATRDVPRVLQASGTVTPVQNVEIIPRVSGYIFERYYTEGTFVDEGQDLYQIDPRPFQDKLDQLKAELKSHEASREFWVAEDKRYSKLAKAGAASQEDAEGARAKLLTTEADIESTKVKIRNAELDLGYTQIKAPFRGRIERTLIKKGTLVTARQDVLTTLLTMDPIYVVFHISRSQVYDVQQLRRQGEAFQIDDFDLIPGQYVPVRFTVGKIADALVIPQKAVVETQAGTFVYVVGDGNKVERRKITPGASHERLLVVTAGLKAGEKVVVSGVQKVKDGMEVKPVADKQTDS